MWYLKKIPKILHMYWGMNKNMSFLRYISILSFSKFNPDWHVLLHVPEKPCHIKPTWSGVEQKGSESKIDYFDKLLTSGVFIKKHNFESYGLSNDIHEVFKNDFLRWIILKDFGGVWSDTDIIYVNPIENLGMNTQDNENADTCLCQYSTGSNAVGFLMSSMNNDFFKEVYNIAKRVINYNDYQSIGSKILNALNRSYPDSTKYFPYLNFRNIDPKSVYSIDCNHGNIAKFYIPLFEHTEYGGTVGYHWYGGDPITQIYESNINEENYEKYDNLMRVLISKVYK